MPQTRQRLLPAFLLALAAAAAPAAAPVPWTAAGEHVRRLVTVEGVVAEATCGGDRRCTLAFDPADPSALRVVLIIPWVTDLPPVKRRTETILLIRPVVLTNVREAVEATEELRMRMPALQGYLPPRPPITPASTDKP